MSQLLIQQYLNRHLVLRLRSHYDIFGPAVHMPRAANPLHPPFAKGERGGLGSAMTVSTTFGTEH